LNGKFKQAVIIEENIKQVAANSFHKIDGLAHQRVAEAILAAIHPAELQRQPYHTTAEKCQQYYLIDSKNKKLKSKLATQTKKGLGLSPNWSFKHRRRLVGGANPANCIGVRQVKHIVDAIQRCAQANAKEPLSPVSVRSALERGDYHFGYYQDRSVVVFGG
jgi:hypothetical protein